jgi:hypothetical protein
MTCPRGPTQAPHQSASLRHSTRVWSAPHATATAEAPARGSATGAGAPGASRDAPI